MDAVDVLMEARAYIEKGWTQHRFYRWSNRGGFHRTSWCALGAIREAITPGLTLKQGWSRTEGPERNEAERLLAMGCKDSMVAFWNDRPERTQEQVLEAFDRAISLGLEQAGER